MSNQLTKTEIRFIREVIDSHIGRDNAHAIAEIERKLRLMELSASNTQAWTQEIHKIDGRVFIERTYRGHFSSIGVTAPTDVLGYFVLYNPGDPNGPVRWKIQDVINRLDFVGTIDISEYAVINGSVVLFEVPPSFLE